MQAQWFKCGIGMNNMEREVVEQNQYSDLSSEVLDGAWTACKIIHSLRSEGSSVRQTSCCFVPIMYVMHFCHFLGTEATFSFNLELLTKRDNISHFFMRTISVCRMLNEGLSGGFVTNK